MVKGLVAWRATLLLLCFLQVLAAAMLPKRSIAAGCSDPGQARMNDAPLVQASDEEADPEGEANAPQSDLGNDDVLPGDHLELDPRAFVTASALTSIFHGRPPQKVHLERPTPPPRG